MSPEVLNHRTYSTASTNVTQLLRQWRAGDEDALDQLMPLVYDDLRRLAGHYMRRERSEHTLQRQQKTRLPL